MATVSIERSGDGVAVVFTVPREALAGMDKPEALAYLRGDVVGALGWPRYAAILEPLAAAKEASLTHVGQLVRAVLSRNQTLALSALDSMVADGIITEADKSAMIGAWA